MKLAHLKVKGDEKDPSDSTREDADRYPEGMAIHADHHSMKAMGLKETPPLGHKVRFEGHGVVVGGHQHASNAEDRHVKIQFTHGGVEHKTDEVPEKSLRDTIGEAHKTAKPIVPREERLARKQVKGKDAGEGRAAHAKEPPKGKGVGA